MALVLIKVAKKDKLLVHIQTEDAGMVLAEEENVGERVTRNEAENLLKAWKKILV